MDITTFIFAIFMMAGLLIYYRIPSRFQWTCLLGLSAVFLWAADWRNLLVAGAVAAIAYIAALYIDTQLHPAEAGGAAGKTAYAGKTDAAEKAIAAGKALAREEKARRGRLAKRAAIYAVTALVLILIFAKYVPAALHLNLAALNETLQKRWRFLKLILPFGLSYYLLMAISYVLDVYWQRERAEKNFLRLCLFISYFPLLTQGPISRYGQLKGEFFKDHGKAFDNLKAGIPLILWGFFKKMVIADRIGVFVRRGCSGHQYGLNVVICLIFYGIDLYCDFSGGIDVVRGISECFGVGLTDNFRQPYFSRDLGEFWRRWHISLGTFMKDYVFFPLALWKPFKRLKKGLKKHMSTKAAGRVIAAIMDLIVFLIVGLWHGTGSQYAGWGIYNGAILAFSALMENQYEKARTALHVDEKTRWWQNFRLVRTLVIVTAGWVFDCKNSASEAIFMFFRMFDISRTNLSTIFPEAAEAAFYLPVLAIACLILLWVDIQHEKGVSLRAHYAAGGFWKMTAAYTFLFQAVLLFGRTVGAGGFMYANF